MKVKIIGITARMLIQSMTKINQNMKKKKKHEKKMDSLICNSYEMLREYCDPKLYADHQFPYDLFQTCKGVIFLRIWKAGFFSWRNWRNWYCYGT